MATLAYVLRSLSPFSSFSSSLYICMTPMHLGRIHVQSIPTNIWCRDPPRHISVEPNYPFSVLHPPFSVSFFPVRSSIVVVVSIIHKISRFPIVWCIDPLHSEALCLFHSYPPIFPSQVIHSLLCRFYFLFISCEYSSSVSMVITRSQSLALFPEEAQRLSSIDLNQSAPPELPTRPVLHRPSVSSVMENQFMNTLGKEQFKKFSGIRWILLRRC